jgi:hypothetical protein
MHRRHVGHCSGVEDEQAGTVLADKIVRQLVVASIGGDGRESLAELGARGTQILLAAGKADDICARGNERGGDRAPEAAAGSGDDGGLEGCGHFLPSWAVAGCGHQDQPRRDNPSPQPEQQE